MAGRAIATVGRGRPGGPHGAPGRDRGGRRTRTLVRELEALLAAPRPPRQRRRSTNEQATLPTLTGQDIGQDGEGDQSPSRRRAGRDGDHVPPVGGPEPDGLQTHRPRADARWRPSTRSDPRPPKIDRPTALDAIDELVAKGLVRKAGDPVSLAPTPAGEDALPGPSATASSRSPGALLRRSRRRRRPGRRPPHTWRS